MIYEYKGKRPVIGKNVYIAPGAIIIGDVTIGDNSSVWFNTVIRADSDAIVIGRNTNIQDNCTLHVDEGQPAVFGDNVTIGHSAVAHGCTVEDNCLIGINCTVLNGVIVRKGSIVAANALVTENTEIGPYHLVTGVPAKLKKELKPDIVDVIQVPADIYVKKAADFQNLKEIG